MKIDLVGPERRGLALGLNESSGYLAVAGTALLTGYIAAESGLRPEPFLIGLAYAALGLGSPPWPFGRPGIMPITRHDCGPANES